MKSVLMRVVWREQKWVDSKEFELEVKRGVQKEMNLVEYLVVRMVVKRESSKVSWWDMKMVNLLVE